MAACGGGRRRPGFKTILLILEHLQQREANERGILSVYLLIKWNIPFQKTTHSKRKRYIGR